ncbi:MAG: M1 family aminopeptidase [Ferruginibacter sp.]
MKKGLLLSISFLYTFFIFSQSNLGNANELPPKQNGRIRNVDIKHISVELLFKRYSWAIIPHVNPTDWESPSASGTAKIILSPLGVSDIITLDAGILKIDAVETSSFPLKFEYDGSDKNDALKIYLDRKYAPNEEIAISINYHITKFNDPDPNNLNGSFGKGVRFFTPSFTEPRKRKQIWSMGMPEGNRYWFPCYDAPDDLRTTEFKATVTKEFTVISNGILFNKKDNNNGTFTYHWKMDRPHANHQTSFVIGEYKDIAQTVDGIELHNYSYPDEVEATKASIVRLKDMMKYYSYVTGMKYPYPRYSQVFVQDFPWGGGHNMMASTISENMVDDFGTHADFFYLWDGVEANDLAAQWFGNLLTPQSWEHSWLNKSFATYFSMLYSEHKNGLDEFQLWNRAFNKTTILGDWNSGVRRPLVTANYDNATTMVADNYAVYYGAEVLHMLRKELGEQNWWKAIKHFVRTYVHNTVTTENFISAIKESTGEDMSWFFQQWVYKMGHPVFEISKKYEEELGTVVTVKQVQKKDSSSGYPQVDFFKGKMDIDVDGKIETVLIEPTEQNVFIFPGFSKLLNVDYGGTWIKEVSLQKNTDEWLYQFENSKDILARNDALTELVNIAKTDSIGKDKAKILEAMQKTVLNRKLYWRFRFGVLGQLRWLVSKPFNKTTTDMLLAVIKNESSWMRSAALFFLSDTRDLKYESLYVKYLNDKSDRVINAAAVALGKSKSPLAFNTLVKLKDKPSWKNQSLISTLNGLQQLNDPRGADIALKALKDTPAAARWFLANSTWDFRVTAAQTLAALGKGNLGYPIVLERFKQSMTKTDISDIFNNVLLITTLADPRGAEIFPLLKERFKNDSNAMLAVNNYERLFNESVKK